tara:strand:- start:132 stop:374 length:243 start_codon:yes stop_codon:yes gene_type:complete
MYKQKLMKYTIIFLALATISCSESSPKEAPKNDTVIIDYLRGTDTIIYDTVQLDTVVVKKKPAKNQYTSKCVAYKSLRIS